MSEKRAKSKIRKIFELILWIFLFRVSLIRLRILADSFLHLVKGAFSILQPADREQRKDLDEMKLEQGWRPKGLPSKLVFFLMRTGREQYLAITSLGGLVMSALVLLFWPILSLPAVFVTVVLFTNIFVSKVAFLVFSDVRIMIKKSIFWRSPSISEFLFAFPLDYFAIILSYANVYFFTSLFFSGMFIDKNGLVLNLDFGESLLYSLSSITTLTLSSVTPNTMLGKLLSFTEILVGIFFLVIFGSMIIGLFLTEKQIIEEKGWLKDKEKLWDLMSFLFSRLLPMVDVSFHKCDAKHGPQKRTDSQSAFLGIQQSITGKVVFKITFPGSPSTKGFQIAIPAYRLKRWVSSLPENVKCKTPELASTLDKILQLIDNEAVGPNSMLQIVDNDNTLQVNVFITEE